MENTSTTNITIRMDKNLKAAAEELYSELGMNLSTAFNIFVRQSIREGGIPFMITTDVPNQETAEALNEYAAMKAHPEDYKRYNTFDDLMDEVLEDA